MASAAAVGANAALSPEPAALTEPGSTVTSAIIPSDEKVPDDLNDGGGDDDDDDEDDVVRARPRGPQMQMNGAPDDEEELGDDDDLFGDGVEADEDEPPVNQRHSDNEDLDSNDDEDRVDRIADQEDTQQVEYEQEQEQAVLEVSMARQPVPEPSDGEMYLTKVPRFLSIDPKVWHHTTYQPPTTEHHSTTAGPTFSPYNTALSTVHWRKSPSNPKETQSNARILRWSDGSLTLQFASNPTQQFVIEGNSLAPRQQHPVKPTPTSRKAGQLQKDHAHDTFTYLTIPDPHNQLVRISHKITAGLSILPSAETTDEALEKLQTSLAAIAQGKNKTAGGNIELVRIDEDPELAKKKAEIAERDKMRAQKRREAAETRERERGSRGLGRRSYGGGLSASMLEDDEVGGAGARPKGNRQKPNRRQRRNSEYSDDEDFGHKRGNFANDEYDEEDEFIARSDEEEEAIASSDSDDGIVNEPSGGAKKKTTAKAAKRPSPEADDDEDAEGEDEEDVVQTSRVKRRRVVDDDDEE